MTQNVCPLPQQHSPWEFFQFLDEVCASGLKINLIISPAAKSPGDPVSISEGGQKSQIKLIVSATHLFCPPDFIFYNPDFSPDVQQVNLVLHLEESVACFPKIMILNFTSFLLHFGSGSAGVFYGALHPLYG